MSIRSVIYLHGYAIQATDGDIGKLDEFYFDDDRWTIRYLVVQTGAWLADRRVLISPISVRDTDWRNRRIVVSLTQDQVRRSPNIDTAKPISRQHEIEFHKHYGWQYYWMGSDLWGAGIYPGELMAAMPPVGPSAETPTGEDDTRDTHLRSTKEVVGYHILATDGEIGHTADFLFDDKSWRIQYMVVDTSNWWPGKKVIIPPTCVKTVVWAERRVVVDLKRETIQNSSEFDPEKLADRA